MFAPFWEILFFPGESCSELSSARAVEFTRKDLSTYFFNVDGLCNKENENKVVSAILQVFKKSEESIKKVEFSQLYAIIANFRLKALARCKANGVPVFREFTLKRQRYI